MQITLTLTQETDLVAVVSPASEFHVAALLVEGEPLDVDLAGRLVNGRRLPDDLSGVVEAGLGHQGHLVLSVGAEEKDFFTILLIHGLKILSYYLNKKNRGAVVVAQLEERSLPTL